MSGFFGYLFSSRADRDKRVMALMADGEFRSAYEISRALKMGYGFLYPSLARLERNLSLDRVRDYAGGQPFRILYSIRRPSTGDKPNVR